MNDDLTRLEQQSQPHSALSVPDLMEPVIGWRVWRVITHDDAPRLSGAFDTIWEPFKALEATHRGMFGSLWVRPNTESCTGSPCDGHVDHFLPKCGIYAFKTEQALRAALANEWGIGPIGRRVIGQVALWGRITEHEHGYRAQFGYPQKLHYYDTAPSDPTTLATLAHTYGIPYEEDTSWKLENRFDDSWRSH